MEKILMALAAIAAATEEVQKLIKEVEKDLR